MAVEVIDLLSSSDASPPPKAKSITAPISSDKVPSRTLDYGNSDDILDLTDNVFGGVPVPPARPAPASVSAILTTNKRSSPKANAPSRATRGASFPTLDDDDPFDPRAGFLDNNNSSSSTNNAGVMEHRDKRPRLDNTSSSKTSSDLRRSSAGENAARAAISRYTSIPANSSVLKPTTSTREGRLSDPIQTSSPFDRSPRKCGKDNCVNLSLDIDEDPFASSPPSLGGRKNQKARENAPGQEKRVQLPSSPIFVSSQPQPVTMTSPPKRKANGKGKEVKAWDHISSSAPEADMEDDWNLSLQPSRKSSSKSRSGTKHFDLGDLASYDFDSDDDDELPDFNTLRASKPSSSRGKSSAPKGAPKKSASEKEIERLDKVAAKEAEKRIKQREKDEAKEQRAREKERAAALAEVNKVRTDKKVSTPEMIAVLPNTLKPSVRLQIETLLEDLNVKCESSHSHVKNVVKWRRRVRARYNEEEGLWEPIAERIENENHAMVIVTASEFVELALGAKGSDLEAHVLRMQRYYDGHTIIYLIEGLTPWMRKNRNVRNRQFQSAVRSASAVDLVSNAPPPSSQNQRRKKDPKPSPTYIDEDALEDALLQLQVQHGALIHHTAAPIETAQWVSVFTQHISTIPYRRQKDAVNSSAAFCMDSGQVRTGDGPSDTYVRMLQEIIRVTPAIAYGIAGEFGTVSDLVRGLETEGPLVLEGIRKSANRDGAYSDRSIGQAISRRVWKVFTSRDETSTDI